MVQNYVPKLGGLFGKTLKFTLTNTCVFDALVDTFSVVCGQYKIILQWGGARAPVPP